MNDDLFLCPGMRAVRSLGPQIPTHRWEVGVRWTSDQWKSHYQQPRICSACGSAHPEDVLRMLSEGWTEEKCDSGYKGYLRPPGLREEIRAWERSFDRAPDNKRAMWLNRYPSSLIEGPPIKFYVFHFSPEQLVELNTFWKTGDVR